MVPALKFQEKLTMRLMMGWRLLFYTLCLSGSLAFAEEAHPVGELPVATFVSLPSPAEPATPKRLFGFIPNYKADQYKADYKPLTTEQKFAIARSDSFDWPNYLLFAGLAVQSQMAAGGIGHGGVASFGKFYSQAVGDQVIGAYVTEAVLPTLWHEDPRFFRLGTGSVWHRASNAAERIFVARKDNGSTGFYNSEIIGNAGVTALASVYYPDRRSASAWLTRYGMSLGNDMMSNLLTEFWPDIKRHFRFRPQQ